MKKGGIIWSAASFAILVLLCACETPAVDSESAGVFELNIRATVDGQSFVKGIDYQNNQGNIYAINELRFFLADIYAIKENGDELLLSELELFDIANPDANKIFHGEGVFKQFELPTGSYAGIRFSLGVPERFNHLSPSDLKASSSLGIAEDMHWNQTLGYIFLLIQGSAKAQISTSNSILFNYQIGLDQLFQQLSFNTNEDVFEVKENEELQFLLELDINRLFSNDLGGVNPIAQPTTETIPLGSSAFDLAEKIIKQFSTKALFKMPF